LVTQVGLEDPWLYQDDRGHCHALLHSLMDLDQRGRVDPRACGAHAFARNCSDASAWRLGGTAYGNTVEYADGSR
jgi:hypothetical protein